MNQVVFTADLHVHPYKLESRDGGVDRLADGLSALRQTLDYARQRGATWVFGGDAKVPRRSWPHDALTGWLDVLKLYPDVEKVFVAGNHDGDGEWGSGLRPFAPYGAVVDRPTISGGVAYWPASAPQGDLEAFLGDAAASADVLVGHGYVAGAKTGPEDFRAPSSLTLERLGLLASRPRFRVALFGDVHKGQILVRGKRGRTPEWSPFTAFPRGALAGEVPLRGAGEWRGEVVYPGSPYAQNWGEREDGPKGCLLVDLESGEVTFLPVRGPRYLLYDWREEPARQRVADAVRDWPENFVRVLVGDWYGDEREAEINGRRGAERSFEVVVTRARRVEQRAEIHGGMSEDELLRAYVRARPLQSAGVAVDEDQCVAAGAALLKG